MNESHSLNGKLVREFLRQESRKQAYLVKELNVSQSLVAQMLNGHVPGEETMKTLARLLGTTEEQLLIPKKAKAG